MKIGKFRLGTGALVAAAFIGPGTVTVCSTVGAKFGYQLLWALIFSVVSTIILQEMVVRLTIKSSTSLAGNIKKEVGGVFGKYVVGGLVLIAIYVGSVAYESGNIAGAAWAMAGVFGDMKISVSESLQLDVYGLIIGGLAIFILSIGKYKIIEKTLIALVITMSIVFVLTAIVIQPDFGALISGFIPRIPDSSVLMIIGLLGTTVVPYNLFLQSSALLQNDKNADYRESRNETTISISLGGLISMAIVITSSVMFFNSDLEFNKVSDLAIQLKPLLGDWAVPFMTLGFFAAGISSALTAPLAAAYTVGGLMGWSGGMQNPKFKAVWLSAIILGILFFSTGIRPTQLIIIAQVANGLLLPIIAVVLIYLMNRTSVLGDLKNGIWQNTFGLIVVIVTTVLGFKSLFSVFGII
ncbi:MAG: Nramp family divalent metal transporter [bacterium]|nr:Nramp family divalent metal transporter [bacterium]